MWAVVFAIGVAGGLGISPALTQSVRAERLNPQIGKANPEAYRSIRDADLRRTLVALQVSAWPYGRVVAVQDASLRAGDLSEGKSIADNRNRALATLKQLGITVDSWAP
jgi:hypothetical protein